MDRGYFPVFRRIFDSDIWGNKVARDVWIFILGNVTHYPTKLCANYGCVELQPGQMVTGLHSLAVRNGFSTREIRTSLNYLQSTSRITRQTTNKYSIITVLNWDIYRDAQVGNDNQNDNHTDKQTTSKRQANDNIQEVKKLKKDQNPAAVALYEFYAENIINEPAKRSDAIRNITKLLDKGHTKEDLAGAVEDYLEKGIGEKPFHPNNFFGQKEYYKGFGKYAK